MKPKTVREIVIEYLKRKGYDGLCIDECGCDIDDLVCCYMDDDFVNCKPAYKIYITEKNKEKYQEYSEYDLKVGDFIMSEEKEKTK